MPDRHLHTPWAWEGAGRLLGKRYPAPIVDVTKAAKQAREKVWGLRSGAAFQAEASRIATKHASRKDSGAGRHFVNDRAPRLRKPRGPKNQLSLDL